MDEDIGKHDVCHQEKKGVIFQELFFCQVGGESNCLEGRAWRRYTIVMVVSGRVQEISRGAGSMENSLEVCAHRFTL